MGDFIKFIGIGSSFATDEELGGNTSAFFYTDNNKTFNLIDCGCTVFKKIVQMDLLKNIKKVNVFITHTHDDHIGSLASLIFYCKYVADVKVNLYDFNLKLSPLPNILRSLGVEPTLFKLNKGIDELSNRLPLVIVYLFQDSQ